MLGGTAEDGVVARVGRVEPLHRRVELEPGHSQAGGDVDGGDGVGLRIHPAEADEDVGGDRGQGGHLGAGEGWTTGSRLGVPAEQDRHAAGGAVKSASSPGSITGTGRLKTFSTSARYGRTALEVLPHRWVAVQVDERGHRGTVPPGSPGTPPTRVADAPPWLSGPGAKTGGVASRPHGVRRRRRGSAPAPGRCECRCRPGARRRDRQVLDVLVDHPPAPRPPARRAYHDEIAAGQVEHGVSRRPPTRAGRPR